MIALDETKLNMLTGKNLVWCENSVVHHIKDMHQMTRDEVILTFPPIHHKDHIPHSPVNDTLLLRTLVWQTYLAIDAKQMEPLHGNQRSMWYRVIEPFYGNHDILDLPIEPNFYTYLDSENLTQLIEDTDEEETFHLFGNIGEGGKHGAYVLGKMSQCIDEFVIREFFTFREPLGFSDPRENFHLVGDTPSIVFFTEKEGFWWLAKEFASTYKISAMASHGETGLVTLEYFTKKISGHKVGTIHLGCLNDYDPWGWEIADNVKEKLGYRIFGDLNVEMHRLTSLKLFDQKAIDYSKRDLRKCKSNKQPLINSWMEKTHGINGEPYSMHIDNANLDKVRQAVHKWYQSIELKKPHRATQ